MSLLRTFAKAAVSDMRRLLLVGAGYRDENVAVDRTFA